MSASIDKGEALRLLQSLEDGGLATADACILAETLDPVLVHVIVKYLRASYPASHPAATAVLDRVVDLTSAYPGIVEKAKQGERDPVSVWLEEDHAFEVFRGRGRELVEMVADKLDS